MLGALSLKERVLLNLVNEAPGALRFWIFSGWFGGVFLGWFIFYVYFFGPF